MAPELVCPAEDLVTAQAGELSLCPVYITTVTHQASTPDEACSTVGCAAEKGTRTSVQPEDIEIRIVFVVQLHT